MSKIKSAVVLFSLAATTLLSACDPVAAVFDNRRPAKDLCLEGHCPTPAPDDLTTP